MLPFGSHQAPLYRGSRQNRLKVVFLERVLTVYRGTSLTRKRSPQGPYRRLMPRIQRGGHFPMGGVPL